MMRVLGLMSGTSADGIDVALVRISGAPPHLRAHLEKFAAIPFPAPLRQAILRLAEGSPTTTAEISELNFLLGEEFARAAIAACRKFRVPLAKIDLIGSHGQTVFHQGAAASAKRVILSPPSFWRTRDLSSHLVSKLPSTLQLGEPAIIAARTGVTTIADFRPADMAAGGQGAPLVPFVDYLLYRHARKGRVALNIGGIANVTVIPPAARPEQVFAFDTGPGNMVIDALVKRFTRGRQLYDRDARIARRGRFIPGLLDELLRDPYFRRQPPKSCGREQYGESYVARLISLASARWSKGFKVSFRGRDVGGRGIPLPPSLSSRAQRGICFPDLVRTATLLTALSIVESFNRFILPRTRVDELVVSGGGAHNPLILAQLQAALPRTALRTSADFGVPEDAKEAFAFAILAYETFHRRPANLPAATGARRPATLGKLCYAPPR